MKRRKIFHNTYAVLLIVSLCFGFTGFKVIQKTEQKNYVHSISCQVDHCLQLDCFDSCNGKQVNSPSQQQHNIPVEKSISNSFEALTVEPIQVICFTSVNIQNHVDEVLFYCNPFFHYLFRPPLKG